MVLLVRYVKIKLRWCRSNLWYARCITAEANEWTQNEVYVMLDTAHEKPWLEIYLERIHEICDGGLFSYNKKYLVIGVYLGHEISCDGCIFKYSSWTVMWWKSNWG